MPMVIKCPVLLNNRSVTVVDFNGVQVQMPAIGRKANYVNVAFEEGRYCVIGDDYQEEPIKETAPVKKKRANRKTTESETDGETMTVSEEAKE